MSSAASSSTAAARAWSIRRARLRRVIRSLAVFVGVPTLLAVAYYGFLAADEYESEAVVVVQSASRGEDSELAELAARFTSGAATGAARDSALLAEVIRSRTMLESMQAEHGFLDHYRSGGDWLGGLDEDAGSEEAYEYFREHVRVSGPSAAGAMHIEVRAFDAEAAQAFNIALVRRAEVVLKDLVSQARIVPISAASLPTEPSYPRRLWGVARVFFVSLALAGVFGLLLGAVREHAKF